MFMFGRKVKTLKFKTKKEAKMYRLKLDPFKWTCDIKQAQENGRFVQGWVLTAHRLPRK